jgi:hypothetical protein
MLPLHHGPVNQVHRRDVCKHTSVD